MLREPFWWLLEIVKIFISILNILFYLGMSMGKAALPAYPTPFLFFIIWHLWDFSDTGCVATFSVWLAKGTTTL